MIRVLLFAKLQETAGTDKIEIDENSVTTVNDVKRKLEEHYHLHGLDQAMVAINEEYAKSDDVVHDKDIIAFIPPVSGG